MPFRIKIRLIELGKKQVDLKKELEERGFKVTAPELSQAINGRSQQKKIMDILSAANEIVTEWEHKKVKEGS